MFFLLFIILVSAETDCYYTDKNNVLPCVSIADLNSDGILNATEIDLYCVTYNLTYWQWNSERVLSLLNKTELTIIDWNDLKNETITEICLVCKYLINLII